VPEALTLPEKVVLLTLSGHTSKANEAVPLISAHSPGDTRHRVLQTLQQRGMVELSINPLHHHTASNAATVQAERDLHRAIGQVGPITDDDAILLVFVAYAGGLDFLDTAERLRARHRIASIGANGSPIPNAVTDLTERVSASTMHDLANALLLHAEQTTPRKPTLTAQHGPWPNIG
jgi:hypothetical protein